MKLFKMLMKLTFLAATATLLMACTGTSVPQNVSGLSKAVGNELPGARGETLADQERIDSTVGRGCAAGVFTRAACDRHTKASAERIAELKSGLTS